ncbi:DUF982 domain-containing protein [Mesorhizobium sp. M0698]
MYVKTDRPGVTYGCNNVEGAAEELLKWTKMGPKWRKAVQLCIEAGEDRATPEEARKAFGAGAKEEEGMFVRNVECRELAQISSHLSVEEDPCTTGTSHDIVW